MKQEETMGEEKNKKKKSLQEKIDYFAKYF